MSALDIASILIGASASTAIAATAAMIWCAAFLRAQAQTRRAVWLGVCATPLLFAIYDIVIGAFGASTTPAVVGIESPPFAVGMVVVWALIATLLAARIVHRHVSLTRWSRGLADHDSELAAELSRVARELGVPSLRVVRGSPGAMPICFGVWSPTLLLPADVATWSVEARRNVALHECAHLAQRDGRIGLLVEIALALLWFHPAMWLAASRVHADGERACDDRVIADGVDPFSYATQLLNLARGARRRRVLPAAALLGRGELEERIAALLVADGKTSAGGPRTRRHRLLGIAVALLATLLATPRVRLSAAASSGVSAPIAIPGAHPGSFATTLFGNP